MAEQAQKTCIICGELKETGITVVTQFICDSCESAIVKTRVEDERYRVFVQRMKRLWVRFLA